ncbi:uncharacterized protein BO66DRAFT_387587 [Aspergillus aculeatinus CBS 121060]|uniref:Uncharacterized protein n=1 Tax=Aspergillus aculeatinus CBS 121060 TaxID=1448322 RepID=A0ACD1HMG4_9EURO|nr:hypothetical protein BO66DRAFT_387587 [Aspergillus aculeatinus CBS 121060]RAH74760.1 hypothetical protein BO66DRAFT_387587 [Aspergillus aculeatinus CBS 121060]
MSKVVRSVKNVTKGYSSVQVKVRNGTLDCCCPLILPPIGCNLRYTLLIVITSTQLRITSIPAFSPLDEFIVD